MTMDAFAKVLREKLLELLENVEDIEIIRTLKNNSVEYTSLIIKEKGINISPTIHLNPIMEWYEEIGDLDAIAAMVVSKYVNARLAKSYDVSFIRSWKKVKEMVVFKLISKEKNAELLAKVPHREVLNLALVYYIALPELKGSIPIFNNHFEFWGISEEELYEAEMQNAPKLLPIKVSSLDEIMKTEDGQKTRAYVVTNDLDLYGAATLLYPESMKILEEKIQSDFYLIPSSIQEFLAVPVMEWISTNEVLQLVKDVNRYKVEKEDFLADSVYLYKRDKREICIAA